jgi:hypothetical protein
VNPLDFAKASGIAVAVLAIDAATTGLVGVVTPSFGSTIGLKLVGALIGALLAARTRSAETNVGG